MKRIRLVAAVAERTKRRLSRSVGIKLGLLTLGCMVVGSYLYFITEYHGSTYGAALRDVLIMLVSGFDVDTPKTVFGTVSALSLLVFGVIFVSILTSEIAAAAVQRRLIENDGSRQVTWRNHVLICGWDPRVDHLVKELHSPDLGERVPIVIVSDALQTNPYDDEMVDFVRGNPTDDGVLERANIRQASRAIILSDSRSADATSQDAKAILTGLAVESIAPEVNTCVEIMDPDNRKHLRHANVNQVVCPQLLSDALLVHATLHPGVPDFIQQILSFGAGSEIYRCPVPPTAHGKSYGEVAERLFREERVTVMAFERDGEIIANADRAVELHEGDFLFLLADACPTLHCTL